MDIDDVPDNGTIMDLLSECKNMKERNDYKLIRVQKLLQNDLSLQYFNNKDKIKMEHSLETTIDVYRESNKHLNKIIDVSKKYNTLYAANNEVKIEDRVTRIQTEPLKDKKHKVIIAGDELSEDRVRRLSQTINWNKNVLTELNTEPSNKSNVTLNTGDVSNDISDDDDDGSNESGNDNDIDLPNSGHNRHGSLFRAVSSKKWDLNDLKAQKDEIQQQIKHLVNQSQKQATK